MAEAELLALIMAGGSGTRFWPLSRKDLPKQFLTLLSDRPLIADTAERIRPLLGPENSANNRLYVCSTVRQETLLKVFLPEAKRILEPEARNTSPCLMLSAVELLREGYGPETVMVVLPSDHHIGDEDAFRDVVRRAAVVARETKGLVTLGIVPDFPHTGYGYIEADPARPSPGQGAMAVRRFVEKPDRETAARFVREKHFFWNGGIFVWTLGALADAFRKYQPAAWAELSAYRTPDDLSKAYSKIPAEPIDIAVLEKAANLYVIPASMGWSDIGSWNALYELRAGEKGGNVIVSGQVHERESRGCLVQVSPGTRVALVGAEDLVIVEQNGVLLVAHRSKDQLVRDIVKDFES